VVYMADSSEISKTSEAASQATTRTISGHVSASFGPVYFSIAIIAVLLFVTWRWWSRIKCILGSRGILLIIQVVPSALFALAIPLCFDTNTLSKYLDNNLSEADVRQVAAGIFATLFFVWAQIVSTILSQEAIEENKVKTELLDDLKRDAGYTKGVARVFLRVVSAKAERASQFLKELVPGKFVSKADLQGILAPESQKESLIRAVYELLHARLGTDGFTLKVFLFEIEGEFIVPKIHFDGQIHKVPTLSLEDRIPYRLTTNPPKSVPVWIVQNRQPFICENTKISAMDPNSPLNSCPCFKHDGAASVLGIPLASQKARLEEEPKAILLVHTDKVEFFKNSDSTRREVELLDDNLRERLLFERDMAKILPLLNDRKAQRVSKH
jgi:hypothetical protein